MIYIKFEIDAGGRLTAPTNYSPEEKEEMWATNNIVIPSSFEGIEVRSINFSGGVGETHDIFKNIKKVILPKTLEVIDSACFWNFRALEEIEFEKSKSLYTVFSHLRKIGRHAFSNCQIRSFPFAKCTKLEVIGPAAFDSCSFTSLDLSKTKISVIHSQAFRDNTITHIAFSKHLQRIGIGAFSDNFINNVDFSGVQNFLDIETEAFSENQITSITFPIYGCRLRNNVFACNRSAVMNVYNDTFIEGSI